MEQEFDNTGVCCEPGSATAVATDEWDEWEDPEIPCEVDFGYPRTIEEMKASLHDAMEHLNDPSYWVTDEEFWSEMKKDLPWLKSFGLRL